MVEGIEKKEKMKTGSKVVCTDDRFPTEIFIYYNCLPVKDRVYTIRQMGVGINHKGEAGEIVVYLKELENPVSSKPPHPERGFAAWRFRELEQPAEAESMTEELAEA